MTEQEIRERYTKMFQDEKMQWESLARRLIEKGVNLQKTLEITDEESEEYEFLKGLA